MRKQVCIRVTRIKSDFFLEELTANSMKLTRQLSDQNSLPLICFTNQRLLGHVLWALIARHFAK